MILYSVYTGIFPECPVSNSDYLHVVQLVEQGGGVVHVLQEPQRKIKDQVRILMHRYPDGNFYLMENHQCCCLAVLWDLGLVHSFWLDISSSPLEPAAPKLDSRISQTISPNKQGQQKSQEVYRTDKLPE